MQWRRGDFTIDTDRERLDRDAIGHWISGSYWATGRPLEKIRLSWDAAAIVFGLYHGDRQIGCARVVSDYVTIAYLGDVFIEPEYRGQGFGMWLVESIVDHPDLAGTRWLLHTRDAHELYRRFGFIDVGPRLMERPLARG